VRPTLRSSCALPYPMRLAPRRPSGLQRPALGVVATCAAPNSAMPGRHEPAQDAHRPGAACRTAGLLGRVRGGAARAGWNLINEPRSAKANGAAEVQAWVAEVAPFVKALAPRQLVTIGEDGFYQAGNCEAS